MKKTILFILLFSLNSYGFLGLFGNKNKAPLSEEQKIVQEVKKQLTVQEHPYFMKINLYNRVNEEELSMLLKKEELIAFPLVDNEMNVLVSFDKIESLSKSRKGLDWPTRFVIFLNTFGLWIGAFFILRIKKNEDSH